jgi:inorganic pyrophosphatase
MSKKLTFEIDFEVNGRKLAIISEKINKVFNQSIKTNVSDELLKQINALKDLEKTSVKTASELEKAYKKSEKALKDTTKATKDHAKAVKDTASTDANKLVAENASA